MPRPDWIEVGRISRPHGVRGEVRVILDTDNPERFTPGSVFRGRPARPGLVGSEAQVWLTVRTVRGDEGFPIVAFNEFDDRDKAEGLRGYLLEVKSSQLPELEDDEYYPFDLMDLEVRDPEGNVTGRVSDLVDSPAHAILVVSCASGVERMVPFVLEAVPTVAVGEGYLVIEPRFLEDLGAVASETDRGGGA
ncbi:MAG: ribosome maturation factor RimM [Actinobacteria bacterium]|nr:ribosome maturation factor RimM [Actinomycetota bacterium]